MDKKKLISLIMISAIHALIYALPFLQGTYYEAYQNAYGFSHVQMGNLISIQGVINLVAYIIGGIAADRLNPKILFLASGFLTGVIGLYSATFPSYEMMMLVSMAFSFTTTFMFWAAMIKATKALADSSSQGYIFGLKETVVCVLSLVFSLSALGLFNVFSQDIKVIIMFYSILCIVSGITTFFIFPNTQTQSDEKGESIIKNMAAVLKIKSVWIIGLLLFCCVSVSILMGRFTPFFTEVGGLSTSFVAFLTIVSANGFANIGSLNGGKIADKIGSAALFTSYCLAFCFIIGLLCVFLPYTSGMMPVFVIISVIFRILNGALRSCYFVSLSQAEIPSNMIGTASGVVSIIGFLPEAFMFSLTGGILQSFSANFAYQLIFILLCIISVLGVFIGIKLDKHLKRIN